MAHLPRRRPHQREQPLLRVHVPGRHRLQPGVPEPVQPSSRADGGFDLEGYRHAIRLWTVVLEICVLMAQFPSEAIAQLSYDFRTLGLGYANLGAMLMRMGIPYDSAEGTQWCAALTAILTGEAYAASAEMAGELGPFAGYERNKAAMLRVIRNHRRAAYNAPASEYEELSITPQGLTRHGRAQAHPGRRPRKLGPRPGPGRAARLPQRPGHGAGPHGHHRPAHGLRHHRRRARLRPGEVQEAGGRRLLQAGEPRHPGGPGPPGLQPRRRSSDIERYVVGWLEITDETPGITRSQLLAKGWTEEETRRPSRRSSPPPSIPPS